MAEVNRVLDAAAIVYERDQFSFHCRFTAAPTSGAWPADGTVLFEIEVGQIERIELCGIRLYRLDGDLWLYKQVCDHITSNLRI